MTGQYPRLTDTFIQREISALRTLGHYVQTFSVRHPPDEGEGAAELAASRNTTIYLLPFRGLLRAHLAQVFLSPMKYVSALTLAFRTCPPGAGAIVRQIAYFAEAAILARSMAANSLTHLHNHFADSSCSVAAIAAEMGGFTFSFTIHGPAEFFAPKYWWLDVKIQRALFVNCISYFCRSQCMLFVAPELWGKFRIVHCGVDPTAFDVKKHVGRGRRLLFVGRLAPAKAAPMLLETLAKVDGVTLDIAGDGPERDGLEKRAAELGVAERVRFLGNQSQRDIRELLRQADVFLMCSISEGLPVVLIEAMAAGVPVVATRIAGIPELVDDGQNGLLVPPGDPAAAATALCRLLEDAELRNRFAMTGRDKVEREFSLRSESNWLAKTMTSALLGKNEGVRP